MTRKFLINGLLLLVLTISLSACSGDEKAEGAGEDYEPIVTDAGQFPIVEEEVTLDILIPSNALVKDFETNEFTKEYEKKTGVHINWEVIPEEGAKEKLNLILTSGDYPDVIMDMGVTPAQMRAYGDKGVFLSLNDLIDDYGIQTKKMFEDMPIVEDGVTTPEGEIYALPQVNECFHCTMPQKMWIYKPWLDKLGLDMPTTTEEFHEVMKAFKTEDPNGNGKADEIPLSGMKNSWQEKIAGFLMNPFIYSEMYVENGEIIVPWDKPEWKEGLEYLASMYDEELIYTGSFTQDMEQYKKLGENPGEPILGAAASSVPSFFVSVDDLSDDTRFSDYEAVPPLKGPDGNQVTLYEPNPVTRPAEFIITNKAEHPDVALRWADAMYEESITKRSVIGRKGIEWDDANEGDIGLNGEPATWTKISNDGGPHNAHWDQTGPSLRTRDFRSGAATPEGHQEVALWNATEKHEPYIPDTVEPVPPLFFSEEQSKEMAKIEETLLDYVDEMTAKFITGDVDLKKDWDKYIENLKSIGIDKYVEINQTAYDEKYK